MITHPLHTATLHDPQTALEELYRRAGQQRFACLHQVFRPGGA